MEGVIFADTETRRQLHDGQRSSDPPQASPIPDRDLTPDEVLHYGKLLHDTGHDCTTNMEMYCYTAYSQQNHLLAFESFERRFLDWLEANEHDRVD